MHMLINVMMKKVMVQCMFVSFVAWSSPLLQMDYCSHSHRRSLYLLNSGRAPLTANLWQDTGCKSSNHTYKHKNIYSIYTTQPLKHIYCPFWVFTVTPEYCSCEMFPVRRVHLDAQLKVLQGRSIWACFMQVSFLRKWWQTCCRSETFLMLQDSGDK